jgi:hypothetical protein
MTHLARMVARIAWSYAACTRTPSPVPSHTAPVQVLLSNLPLRYAYSARSLLSSFWPASLGFLAQPLGWAFLRYRYFRTFLALSYPGTFVPWYFRTLAVYTPREALRKRLLTLLNSCYHDWAQIDALQHATWI